MAILLLLLILTAALILGVLAISSRGAPGKRQLADFAARQHLSLTLDNAPVVARALAITHRWRRFGLGMGLAAGILWAAREQRLTLNFAAMFIGWFIGAVIAQWRITTADTSAPRRSAELTERSVSTFVTRANRIAFWSMVALLLGAAAAAAVGGLLGEGTPSWRQWWAWTLVSGGAAVALWLTMRRVVERPRSLPSADLRDADDALRGHALTVLTGSAVAAAGLPLANFLEQLATHVSGEGSRALNAASLLALIGAVILGWLIASKSRSVRARAPREVTAA